MKTEAQPMKGGETTGATGQQDFVAHAPWNLGYVADFECAPEASGRVGDLLVGADAGCIARNGCLYCASIGLATVVRGLVDRKLLAAKLGPRPTQRIAQAQSVGLPAGG